MPAPRHIPDAERRARLVARHHLGRTAGDVVEAVRGVVALHATDPATPYLSARARVPDLLQDDVADALLTARSLWRLHAMRRTLFVVPAEDAPVFDAAACRDVAARERRRLEGWLADVMAPEAIPAFVESLEAEVLEALAGGGEHLTRDLTTAIPGLSLELTLGSGKWSTRSPISSRVLFLMALDGLIVRTRPAGSWRSSQYRWAVAGDWFGRTREPLDPGPARAELARLYLARHGPATLDDLRWWTGWTKRASEQAIAGVGAVPVRLDGGLEGFVLPDDHDPAPQTNGTVAFLPALDSTPMGWKHRDWFACEGMERLFDRNGNVGPTIWVDGRVVGGWAQRKGGEVVFELLEEVGREARQAMGEEAAALTAWLGEDVVIPRFRTPLERRLVEQQA